MCPNILVAGRYEKPLSKSHLPARSRCSRWTNTSRPVLGQTSRVKNWRAKEPEMIAPVSHCILRKESGSGIKGRRYKSMLYARRAKWWKASQSSLLVFPIRTRSAALRQFNTAVCTGYMLEISVEGVIRFRVREGGGNGG